MKQIAVVFSALLMAVTASAQDKTVSGGAEKNKKVAFEVYGNCEMCKVRIEKAALKVKGVKYASWDIPSKQFSMIMDERKCSEMDVKTAIAAVGHDTKEVKATKEAYAKLDACCKYDRDGKVGEQQEHHH